MYFEISGKDIKLSIKLIYLDFEFQHMIQIVFLFKQFNIIWLFM